MTVKDVATYLRCHETTVYRLLYTRAIPAFKVGRDWRFSLESIEQWTKAKEITAMSLRRYQPSACRGNTKCQKQNKPNF